MKKVGGIKAKRSTDFSFKGSDADKKEDFPIEFSTEPTDNWRDIIFVPFHKVWTIILVLSVLIHVSCTFFDLVFNKLGTTLLDLWSAEYLFQLVYLIDTVLHILHRNMSIYRKRRIHLSRNLFAIAFDVLSLLPIMEMYSLLSDASHTKYKSPYVQIWRVVVVIRCYRVVERCELLRKTTGYNQVFVTVLCHFLEALLLCLGVSGIWYYLSCWKCEKPNWTFYVESKNVSTQSNATVTVHPLIFQPSNPIHWFLLCITHIANRYNHNAPGYIRGETSYEKLVELLVIFGGLFAHYMLFNGHMTVAFLKILRQHFQYCFKLHSINHILRDWKCDGAVIARTKEYFRAMWTHRRGQGRMPSLFFELPYTLQKEVAVDIFYEALRHSHLYTNEDLSLKRALALKMDNKSYLPGDYLFRYNELKHEMCYISTGIVQILSDEDDESPVLSFSGGTLLGETCTLMPAVSLANVRCATYCEVQTLGYVDVHKILLLYPPKRKSLYEQLGSRLTFAKQMKDLKDERTMVRSFKGYVQDDSESDVKWIKQRWRLIYDFHRNQSLRVESGFQTEVQPEHCSNYLDLLVLSEDVELKIMAVCLTSKLPYVLEPDSSFRKAWDCFNILNIMIQAILYPYMAAFTRKTSFFVQRICIVSDLINFFDFLIVSTTAIRLKHTLISKPLKIIVERFKSMQYLLDMCAILPFDYFAWILNADKRLIPVLKLNRLLKMYKPFLYIYSKQKTITFNTVWLRTFKYFLIYFLTYYWLSCATYSLACYYKECTENTWIFDSSQRVNGNYTTLYGATVVSLFYTSSIFFSTGATSTYQRVLVDVIWAHFMVQLGYYLFSFCVSEITAYFVLKISSRQVHLENLESTRKFMVVVAEVSKSLQLSVLNYMKFQWLYNKSVDVMSPTGIINALPHELKHKILIERIIGCLKQNPLFGDADPHILECIANVSTIRVLPPAAIVVAADSKSTTINVIMRGSCKLYSFVAGDKEKRAVKIIESGYFFPLLEVLHNIWSLITVEAITTVEILSVPVLELNQIYKANPEFSGPIIKATEAHKKRHELLLVKTEESFQGGSGDEYSLPKEGESEPKEAKSKLSKSKEPKSKQSKSIRPKTHRTKFVYDEYIKPFSSLGHWSLLRLILLRTTIDPQSKCFVAWEAFRCTFIISQLLIFNMSYNILYRFHNYINYASLALKLTGFIDMYLRLHLQFYNRDGILISHPLITAKHYWKSAFLMDFVSAFPAVEMGLAKLLPTKWYRLIEIVIGSVGMLQFYRISGALEYVREGTTWNRARHLQTFKYFLILTMSLHIFANLLMFMFCNLPPSHLEDMVCEESCWLLSSHMSGYLKPWQVYFQTYYMAFIAMTGANTGTYRTCGLKEMLISPIIFCLGFLLRIFFLCQMTSSGVVGNEKLTVFRENVIAFKKFTEHEPIDEDVINLTIEHYEHEWKCTQGRSLMELFHGLHPNLHKDLTYYLFGDTLRCIKLFSDCEESFFQILSLHLNQVYMKKDRDIIRMNDVQDKLFIVVKGVVSVEVAGQTLAVLTRGGIFGNLSENAFMRQKIKATTKIHSVLLTIPGNLFHKILQDYPSIWSKLKQTQSMRSEYMETERPSDDRHDDLQKSQIFDKDSCWVKFTKKINKSIKRETFWFKVWYYTLEVHLACISSIFHLYMVIIMHGRWVLPNKIIMYSIDGVYLFRIIVIMHTPYVDPESGLLVVNRKKIRTRYFKSFFWLDVISLLPLELVVSPFIADYYEDYFSLNRVFRFFIMVIVYNESKTKLAPNYGLQWMHFVYWLLFFLQTMTCVWWLTACGDDSCTYQFDDMVNKIQFIEEEDFVNSQFLAYHYVLNVISMSGIRLVSPTTLLHIGISIVMMLCSLYVTAILTSAFASTSVTTNYTMSTYEYKILKVLQYLQDRDLSPALTKKVWDYLFLLWARQKGEWMPFLISEAPPSIKQGIMLPLYGKAIEHHFLFGRTHVDFIRQLTCHLKRSVYFPGYTIVEKGDVDGNMYFVHGGEVSQIEVMGRNEIPQKIISKGMSFGEAAGLFNIPHKQTFRAVTMVDVLQLQIKDWEYLMDFFPASKEEIYLRAQEGGIKPPSNIRDSNTYY